jgi:hypothetical protein
VARLSRLFLGPGDNFGDNFGDNSMAGGGVMGHQQVILYRTTYFEYALIWVSTPLFLEDENISRKSATLVVILSQFRVADF